MNTTINPNNESKNNILNMTNNLNTSQQQILSNSLQLPPNVNTNGIQNNI